MSDLPLYRETSNKTLNTINNVGLVPFLMAMLDSRTRFPAKLVVAAGTLYASYVTITFYGICNLIEHY
jgi:hypothetical protein